MWNKKIKKTIYTLNLNPDAYKEITDMTYPLIKRYCHKIGADFHVIDKRKFPEWKSPTYEKTQIYELGQQMENDWNIFFDCDAIIHPDTPDFTSHFSKDTVIHNGSDFASLRWKYDRYFLRDGRNIGSPTWLCIASDWCIELFKPFDDMTPDEVYSNIFPIQAETIKGYEPYRLVEDYLFSRNIAKYGLKFDTIIDFFKRNNFESGNFFWHIYAVPIDEKVVKMRQRMEEWGLI